MGMNTITELQILEAAKEGLTLRLAYVQERIAVLRGMPVPATETDQDEPECPTSTYVTPPAKKRTMSAAARKRISAAQKKRWAAQRTK